MDGSLSGMDTPLPIPVLPPCLALSPPLAQILELSIGVNGRNGAQRLPSP